MSVTIYDLRGNAIATGATVKEAVANNRKSMRFANLCSQDLIIARFVGS